ncbi:MAG: metallophosphoesterase [Bacteroidota bacterium]
MLLFISLDAYLYQALKPRIRGIQKAWLRKTARGIFIASAVLSYLSVGIILAYFVFRTMRIQSVMNLAMMGSVLFLIPKIFGAVVFLIEDIFRLLGLGIRGTQQLRGKGKPDQPLLPSRRKFVGQLGVIALGLPFASILYGITKGKYAYQVRELSLHFPDLPKAFDGFKIAQISDIHSGSFDSLSGVRKGISLLMEQAADMILFTGDIVNNRAAELEPWLDEFGKLSAPYGVHSVLGNHDYGDYVSWESQDAKETNLQQLKNFHRHMGFNLMLNRNQIIEKDGEKIALLGVENWGKPPFPQHGDLQRALQGTEEVPFKILMSHDPSHWDGEIIDHPDHIHLTLSGHTHGMQFGIEIPGWRWSPVKYRYPRWADLHQEKGQYLYVNRGFGFLGFPGRVGIWPEITIINLRTA